MQWQEVLGAAVVARMKVKKVEEPFYGPSLRLVFLSGGEWMEITAIIAPEVMFRDGSDPKEPDDVLVMVVKDIRKNAFIYIQKENEKEAEI